MAFRQRDLVRRGQAADRAMQPPLFVWWDRRSRSDRFYAFALPLLVAAMIAIGAGSVIGFTGARDWVAKYHLYSRGAEVVGVVTSTDVLFKDGESGPTTTYHTVRLQHPSGKMMSMVLAEPVRIAPIGGDAAAADQLFVPVILHPEDLALSEIQVPEADAGMKEARLALMGLGFALAGLGYVWWFFRPPRRTSF